MSRLQNLGPTGEPIGDVPAAEFVEVGAKARHAEQTVSEESVSLGELWGIMPLPLKIILGTAPVWLVAMCATMSSEPPPPELTPEQLVAATDMAVVAHGSAAAGTPLYLDDLKGEAGGTCAGKFIWAFNADGDAGSVSLRDEQGTAITSGNYQLSEQNLRLSDLVERRPGGAADKAVKNVTYHIDRTPEGRIIIGKKDYRRCTPKSENATAAAAAPAAPPTMPQYAPGEAAQAAAPTREITPSDVCTELEADASRILTQRMRESSPSFSVIEVNQVKNSAVAANGEFYCTAIFTTSFGHLGISYRTDETPKGQLMIYVEPNDELNRRIGFSENLGRLGRDLGQIQKSF